MKWTEELLLEESKKYENRTDFARKSNSAYKHSLKLGLLDKMYSFSARMYGLRRKKNREEIIKFIES